MKIKITPDENGFSASLDLGEASGATFGANSADEALGFCVARAGVPRGFEALGRFVREHAAELGIEIDEQD